MKTRKTVLSLFLVLSLTLLLSACAGKPAAPATAAQKLLQSYQSLAKTETSPAAIAEALLADDALPFEGVSISVEPGELMGFTAPVTDFAEGAVFAPVIGSIPFIGYIFRLNDGQNADAFLQSLQSSADLRWNICTQAEETVTGSVGRTVFFVMSPLSFEE